jgi:flagellar motor protein MotB
MMRTDLASMVNRRIEAVYDHLNKEEHISTSRLYTENRLARDPIATEATVEGRMRNERVDVALYY